jgi:hypothetical protein
VGRLDLDQAANRERSPFRVREVHDAMARRAARLITGLTARTRDQDLQTASDELSIELALDA